MTLFSGLMIGTTVVLCVPQCVCVGIECNSISAPISDGADRRSTFNLEKRIPEFSSVAEAICPEEIIPVGFGGTNAKTFEAQSLSKLEDHFNNGDISQAIQLLSGWPEGNCEKELWARSRSFAEKLEKANAINGMPSFLRFLRFKQQPATLVIPKLTETTREDRKAFSYFIRTAEIDLDLSRPKIPPQYPADYTYCYPFAFVGGNVNICWDFSSGVIMAGGKFVASDYLLNTIVVSCGDIEMRGARKCLIIARGSVRVKSGAISDTRIISGKSVIFERRKVTENVDIIENERNPLGIIHWDNSTKAKQGNKKQ